MHLNPLKHSVFDQDPSLRIGIDKAPVAWVVAFGRLISELPSKCRQFFVNGPSDFLLHKFNSLPFVKELMS